MDTPPAHPSCHCIIGHPGKAKFLAIKHRDGWQPPTLKFPAGLVDYKATLINDGMMRKYGLKTRVVRVLQNWPDYNCIELELPDGASTKNIHAVWVDREQYLRSRNQWARSEDPIEQWLLDRERATTPRLRPPFNRPGWFASADHWIHFQLDKLGVQVTGSVQQFRVGWNASCLLWVPTSEGDVYFKAGYAKPPGEARMTLALAKKWPELVTQPMAADLERNWMLNRDFKLQGSTIPPASRLPGFARAIAAMQAESGSSLEEWETLGCPRHDLDYQLALIEGGTLLMNSLREGPGALRAEEWERLAPALHAQAGRVRQLRAFEIPDALVHLDFQSENLLLAGEAQRIIDWGDVVIGHPFQVLQQLYDQYTVKGLAMAVRGQPVGLDLEQEITQAYLEAFLPCASADRLGQAMALARQLFSLWKFASLRYELDWAEPGSPRHTVLIFCLQNAARRLLSAEMTASG